MFSVLHPILYFSASLLWFSNVWRSLSRSLLLSCFHTKRQIWSLGPLSTTRKWEALIVHKSFHWNVKLFLLWKLCSPTQSLKTDNYPRTWNRINMHWSMSWTFPSANNKGNCCQSTKQGERLALFLRQLRLATVYSLSPWKHAAQQKGAIPGLMECDQPADCGHFSFHTSQGWSDTRSLPVNTHLNPDESELIWKPW